ncbi:hypothetical protein IWQ61_007799, partial [Dispira simplex]
SLFSTELRRIQCVFHREHQNFMSEITRGAVTTRNIANSYRVKSVTWVPQIDLTDTTFRTFKVLSRNSVPLPAMGPPGSYFVNRDRFYVAKEYFVQPVTKLGEKDVSLYWVDLYNTSDGELLKLSPIMLLVPHQKNFETWALVYEFFC